MDEQARWERYFVAALAGISSHAWDARDKDELRMQLIVTRATRVADAAILAADARANAKPKLDIEIVPAPGDRCGGTKFLPSAIRCPGCRACS